MNPGEIAQASVQLGEAPAPTLVDNLRTPTRRPRRQDLDVRSPAESASPLPDKLRQSTTTRALRSKTLKAGKRAPSPAESVTESWCSDSDKQVSQFHLILHELLDIPRSQVVPYASQDTPGNIETQKLMDLFGIPGNILELNISPAKRALPVRVISSIPAGSFVDQRSHII